MDRYSSDGSTLNDILKFYDTGGTIDLGSEGDQIYRGTDFKAGNDISLTSKQGKVALLSIKDTENYSKTTKGKGALWQTDKGEGSYDESLKFGEMSAGGKINIRAKEGVKVDIEKGNFGKTDRETIDRMIAEDPSKAWMSSLYESGDLTLNSVEETHKDWEYDNSGLTQEAQLAVTIAASTALPGGMVVSSLLSGAASTSAISGINSLGRGGSLDSALNDSLDAAQKTIGNSLRIDNLEKLVIQYAASKFAGGYATSQFSQTGLSNPYLMKMTGAFAGSAGASIAYGLYKREDGFENNLLNDALNAGMMSAAFAGSSAARDSAIDSDYSNSVWNRDTSGIWTNTLGKSLWDTTAAGLLSKVTGKNDDETAEIMRQTMVFSTLHHGAREMRKYQIERSKQYKRPDGSMPNDLNCKNSFDGKCIAGVRNSIDPYGNEIYGDGPAGGNQGSVNKRLGILADYNVNDPSLKNIIMTNLLEHFGGTHDHFNDPIYYDKLGNNQYPDPDLTTPWYQQPNIFNLFPAAPFAGASMMDPWFYQTHIQHDK